MTVFADPIKRFRGNMSGNTQKLFILLLHILCNLGICIAHENNETTIHFFPLENMTMIPDEYKNLSRVGKCCPPGEVFIKNGEDKEGYCSVPRLQLNQSFSPSFSDFNRTGYWIPAQKHSEFVVIFGEPCKHKRYILNPWNQNDIHHLLINGSVFIPDEEPLMLMPGVNYCMEIVESFGLMTFVCYEDLTTIASPQYSIYSVGLLISVPFLVLTVVVYSITPKLRNIYGRLLCRYCGCLAVAFTTLAITQLRGSHMSQMACTSLGFVIQFSFVACFFWLNAMCIEMWSLVRSHVDRETYKRMQPRTIFLYYSLWCWCPSVIFTFVLIIADLTPAIPDTYTRPNIVKNSCWLKSDDEVLTVFYLLTGLLLFGNIILFVKMFIKLKKHQQKVDASILSRNDESDHQDMKYLRRLSIMACISAFICFLMTFNWMSELIYWLVIRHSFAWTSFDIVNAFQGVLIFGLFVLRTPQRHYAWYRIQQIRGIDAAKPKTEDMVTYLFPKELRSISTV
ncbi:G-protein coupled receptor Mth2-like [Hylaeus volcanicus]|uniref:G-protein coupled receptor Mth2-like n=1 Tax=Hylaeus volcanicus TaxID=313075 RepID=UPI0023B8460A|nr:G-protein coupled receptor Mth2-like [Hylaeus volcanicus]